MTNNKNRGMSDYLRECMADVGQGPIDIFQKAFCSVCANRECSRSSANGLAFDRRMLNWKSDLFDNIPRGEDSSKQFISTHDSIKTTVQNHFQPISQPIIRPVSNIETPIESIATPPDCTPEVLKEKEVISPPPPSRVQPELENTPFSQGTILHKHTQPKTQVDVELEVGGGFTFGGDDE